MVMSIYLRVKKVSYRLFCFELELYIIVLCFKNFFWRKEFKIKLVGSFL